MGDAEFGAFYPLNLASSENDFWIFIKTDQIWRKLDSLKK